MTYANTQRGTTIIWTMLGALAVFFIILAAAGAQSSSIAIVTGLTVLAVIGWLFSSLSVEVSDTEVSWFFGPGFWRKSVPLSNISSAKKIRTKWWYGFGIRMTPKGWLYNVSGLDAVELKLNSGKSILVGTNQPEELADAISAARS